MSALDGGGVRVTHGGAVITVMGIMVTGLLCEEAHPVFIQAANSRVEAGVGREARGVAAGREAGVVDQVAVAEEAEEPGVAGGGNRVSGDE
jgi:hypothetical protein